MPRKLTRTKHQTDKPSLRQRYKAEQHEEHVARKQEIDQDLRAILDQETTPNAPANEDNFMKPVLPSAWQLLPQSWNIWRHNAEAGVLFALLPAMLAFLGTTFFQPTVDAIQRGTYTGLDMQAWIGLSVYGTASIWSFLTTAPTLYLGLAASRGEHPSIGQCWHRGLRFLPRLLLLYVTMFLLVLGGLLLFVVPGLLLLRRVILAPYYLVDHNLSVRQALRRSADETQPWSGAIWGMFGVFLTLGMIGVVINALARDLGGALTGIGGILGAMANLLYNFAPALRYQEIRTQADVPEVTYGSRV